MHHSFSPESPTYISARTTVALYKPSAIQDCPYPKSCIFRVLLASCNCDTCGLYCNDVPCPKGPFRGSSYLQFDLSRKLCLQVLPPGITDVHSQQHSTGGWSVQTMHSNPQRSICCARLHGNRARPQGRFIPRSCWGILPPHHRRHMSCCLGTRGFVTTSSFIILYTTAISACSCFRTCKRPHAILLPIKTCLRASQPSLSHPLK